MRSQRPIRLVVAISALLVMPYGCSSQPAAPSGLKGPVTIPITERNGSIQPSGDTVQAGEGQKIVLVVDSDAPDEIHVHSDPDHEFEVKAGANQRFTFSIAAPGTYEVESHGLDVVIVKLQIS
jgi:hypothetical protein